MFIYAAGCIALALVFYTVGVWSEKIQRYLKTWHVVIFWFGLILDTIGTNIMRTIAGSFSLNLHGITGLLAVIVMTFHVIWATFVLLKKDERMKTKFHKFSVIVWFIWLIPIIVGMVYSVRR